MDRSLLEYSVAEFASAVAAKQPAPGGGAVAALSTAHAAALVAMAARYGQDQLPDAMDVAAAADDLRERVAELADADARAYSAVLEAYALPKDDREARRARIQEALTGATQVPLEIAELGAQVAQLAGRLTTEGNRNLIGDAQTAVLLADAAVRSAAGLVRINVVAGGLESGILISAQQAVSTADDASRGARSAAIDG